MKKALRCLSSELNKYLEKLTRYAIKRGDIIAFSFMDDIK